MYTFSTKKKVAHNIFFDLFVFAVLFAGLWLANGKIDQLKKYSLPRILTDFHTRVSRTISRLNEKKLTADLLAVSSGGEVLSLVAEKAEFVPVLMYHGIVDKAEGLDVSSEQFRKQMVALKKSGWTTLTLEDFADFWAGKASLPAKSFLLTFDDGRKDSFYSADPILEVLGFRAVMFIITAKRQASDFHLTEKEIRKMKETTRWELASHTQNAHNNVKIDSLGKTGHELTNRIWLEKEGRPETFEEFSKRVNRELADSRKDIAELYGIEAIAFVFPYGDYGQNSLNEPRAKEVIAAEVKKHYKIAFYQALSDDEHPANYPDENTFMAKRITIKADMDERGFLEILSRN